MAKACCGSQRICCTGDKYTVMVATLWRLNSLCASDAMRGSGVSGDCAELDAAGADWSPTSLERTQLPVAPHHRVTCSDCGKVGDGNGICHPYEKAAFDC